MNFLEGVSIDQSNPITKLIMQILGAVAEMERNLIISRTRAAMSQIKENIAKDGFHVVKRDGKTHKIKKLGPPKKAIEKGFKNQKAKNEERRMGRAAQMAPYFIQAIETAKKRRPVPVRAGKIPQDIVFHEFRQIPKLLVPLVRMNANNVLVTFNEHDQACIAARDISKDVIRETFLDAIHYGYLDEGRLFV